MPTLIVEQPGKRYGGPIAGRVLIGRLPTNGIVVTESTVSRLHAWIDRDKQGHWFVGDGGSLAGTQVNGRAVARRCVLANGDIIAIGKSRIVFSLEEPFPADIPAVDLAGRPPSENINEAGVLFNCPCGAPVWFKAGATGQAHVCRHCGQTLVIPDRPNQVARAVEPREIVEPGMPPPKKSPPSRSAASAPAATRANRDSAGGRSRWRYPRKSCARCAKWKWRLESGLRILGDSEHERRRQHGDAGGDAGGDDGRSRTATDRAVCRGFGSPAAL